MRIFFWALFQKLIVSGSCEKASGEKSEGNMIDNEGVSPDGVFIFLVISMATKMMPAIMRIPIPMTNVFKNCILISPVMT